MEQTEEESAALEKELDQIADFYCCKPERELIKTAIRTLIERYANR